MVDTPAQREGRGSCQSVDGGAGCWAARNPYEERLRCAIPFAASLTEGSTDVMRRPLLNLRRVRQHEQWWYTMFRVPSELSEDLIDITTAGGTTLVRYRQTETQRRNRVMLERHAIVVVIRGEKTIHEPAAPRTVRAGAAAFLRRGSHVMSETLPAADTGPVFTPPGMQGGRKGEDAGDPCPACYRSMLLFFDDAITGRILRRWTEDLDDCGSMAPQAPASHSKRVRSVIPVPLTPHLKSSLSGIWPHFVHPESGPPLTVKLGEILSAIIAAAPEVGSALAPDRDRDHRLRRVVESHFTLPLTLAELADLYGRSLSTFKRDFQRVFGTSPGAWIRQRRLGHARALLATTHCTVTEACYESGFGTLSHFVQAFRETHGVTPKQFQLRAHR